MAKIFVNVATGPENPTRAALGLFMARIAAGDGHEVQVFFAGDGVHLLRPETAEQTRGIGTGEVAEHLAELRAAGVPLFMSGLSAKARELEAAEDVQAVPPAKLVELAVWADTSLTY
jgi:predicted peroxiredoxin